MRFDRLTSEAVRKAIGYLTDPRPAWLWTGDGSDLVWQNPAAMLFRAKIKRRGLKRAALAVPIRGQVARAVRLGAIGRASLSRVQFLCGSKPVSATCTCLPLRLEDGSIALLIVAVDPVDPDIFAEYGLEAERLAEVFGADTGFALIDSTGTELAARGDRAAHEDAAVALPAGAAARMVILFPLDADAAVGSEEPAPDDHADTAAEPEDPDAGDAEPERRTNAGLRTLVDKLAENAALYSPLGEADDAAPDRIASPAPDRPEAEDASGIANDPDEPEGDAAAFVADADQAATRPDNPAPAGQGEDGADPAEAGPAEETAGVPEDGDGPDNAATEHDRTGGKTETQQETGSRYNFAELSRILSDRVGGEPNEAGNGPADSHPVRDGTADGALINLSDETLVLNRLPIGLLIFRDQEILFANRTLTDTIGYPDSASLRKAGMSALFPRLPDTDSNAGPVTHLAHRDGSQVPVAARLQSISWQGKPAFLMSARQETSLESIEGEVRMFAERMAAATGAGYFQTSRAGIIESISGRASDLLGHTPEHLIGRPLGVAIAPADTTKFREFLEQPARFAETARPAVVLRGLDPSLEVLVFAEGRAGIVTGYFGLVQQRAGGARAYPAAPDDADSIDPAVLGRLSRGIRRPLNTVVGFSELIRSAAFGPIDNPRYTEYARDIKFAGQEIVGVLDELEEFVRLNSGEYEFAATDFDLGALLDRCMSRVRAQAGRARVLIRSAISEHLPHIRADEASLGQAVLNLLASAIDQTPQGGQVVLSAQIEDDGAVAIRVRDSGTQSTDLAERFVVFRDGSGQDGEPLHPIQSSVGLALTRSLVKINTCTLSTDFSSATGTLFSLVIPAELAIPATE